MRRALAAGLLLALASHPATATELFQHGDARLVLTGSLRELANIGSQTDRDAFESEGFDAIGERDAWQSLTRLRLRLDAQLTPWLRGVVVYDNELRTGILDTFESDLGRAFVGGDLVDAETTVIDEDRVSWRHLLYRGFLKVETEHLDLAVGRLRVPWGVGRLWNPIDRFNPIGPLAVQADQSPGVDGVQARWAIDGFRFVEAVYAPGRRQEETRVALRGHAVAWDTDVSVVGGLFEQAPTVGLDLARNLGDAAGRVELVWADPHRKVPSLTSSTRERPDDFFQVVGSVDYTFDVADGIYLLLEHLYNGNALGFGQGPPGPLLPFVDAGGSTALFGSSQVVTSAEHQTGLLLGGDITPELRLDFLTIYDWNGESAAFFPSLRYTPLAALEVTVGVQTFAGPRLSQFGSQQTFVYLLADLFF